MLSETDFESLLPLRLIRQHIGDDDTERFSEDQLSLYRESAFEACEAMTGLLLMAGRREHSETASLPRAFTLAASFSQRPQYHRLKYPSATGMVNVTSAAGNQLIIIPVGSREIPLSILNETVSFGECALACDALKMAMTFTYETGHDGTVKHLPAGLRVGMLQYITFLISNPGDTIVHTINSTGGKLDARDATSAVKASGALESWLPYCRGRVR